MSSTASGSIGSVIIRIIIHSMGCSIIIVRIHHSYCTMFHDLSFDIFRILMDIDQICILQMCCIFRISILFIHTGVYRLSRFRIGYAALIRYTDPLPQTSDCHLIITTVVQIICICVFIIVFCYITCRSTQRILDKIKSKI